VGARGDRAAADVALLARSESWHLTIQAARGTFDRRILYRASSFPVLGSMIDGQLGRGADRRAAAVVASHQSTGADAIAAEFPIRAVEARWLR
jgi:hypothetical protein